MSMHSQARGACNAMFWINHSILYRAWYGCEHLWAFEMVLEQNFKNHLVDLNLEVDWIAVQNWNKRAQLSLGLVSQRVHGSSEPYQDEVGLGAWIRDCSSRTKACVSPDGGGLGAEGKLLDDAGASDEAMAGLWWDTGINVDWPFEWLLSCDISMSDSTLVTFTCTTIPDQWVPVTPAIWSEVSTKSSPALQTSQGSVNWIH